MVGLYEGPTPTVRARFSEGLEVALIGQPGQGWLAGSVYARLLGFDRHGAPPPVDYVAEGALHAALRALIAAGEIEVAHDLSDGGLLVALAECTLDGVGGRFDVATGAGALYGEDHGRALIAYRPEARDRVLALLAGVPSRVIGLAAGDVLGVGARTIAVADITRAWGRAFPDWLAGASPRR
jgi:phosphoribosylformylglycinamidine synthase